MLQSTLNVRSGSLADKPSRAKIQFCLLWSKSGQTRVRLDCPLCAIRDRCAARWLLGPLHSTFCFRLLMQKQAQQGAVDLDLAIVINQAQSAKFVHEKVDACSRCSDHLR